MPTIEQVFLDTKAIFQQQAEAAMEEVMCKIYQEYLPHVENDTCFNVRQQSADWIERFMADKISDEDVKIYNIKAQYSGKDVRAKMFQDNKEELTKLIGQDIIDRVKDLEERAAQDWERRYV
jgi:hypothetical protein